MAKALSDTDVRRYHEDGYVVIKGLLEPEETGLLARAAREDRVLDQHSFGRADGEGGTVRLSLWNHPTDTIYGMVARSESIVGSAEKILNGEVYHYHSKMIMKDPKVGGAWLAPGLWLLVSQWGAVSAADQRVHRGRSCHAREWLHAGHQTLP